jgi:hypothetical protein
MHEKTLNKHLSLHCNTSSPHKVLLTPSWFLSCRLPLCLGRPAAPLLEHHQHPRLVLEQCQLSGQHPHPLPLGLPQPRPLVQQQHPPLVLQPLLLGLPQHQPLAQGLGQHQHQRLVLPARPRLVQQRPPLPCLAPAARQLLAGGCLVERPPQRPAPPSASTSQPAKPPSPQQPLVLPQACLAPATCLGRPAADWPPKQRPPWVSPWTPCRLYCVT